MIDERIIDKPDRMTQEQLREHIKAIGEAIVKDAERIIPTVDRTFHIRITAEIKPESVTTIEYKIERYADPRITR